MSAPVAPTDAKKQTTNETVYQAEVVTETAYETVAGS